MSALDGWVLIAVIIVAFIVGRIKKDYKTGLYFGAFILLMAEVLRWLLHYLTQK